MAAVPSPVNGCRRWLDPWATWCGPRREEMPLIQDAFEAEVGPVRFLGVVTQDRTSAAADFAAETAVTYPHVLDAAGDLLAALGMTGLPVALGIDTNGRVIATQIGTMAQDELTALIDLLRADSGGAATGPPDRPGVACPARPRRGRAPYCRAE